MCRRPAVGQGLLRALVDEDASLSPQAATRARTSAATSRSRSGCAGTGSGEVPDQLGAVPEAESRVERSAALEVWARRDGEALEANGVRGDAFGSTWPGLSARAPGSSTRPLSSAHTSKGPGIAIRIQ
ncbi:hypothetical protein ACH4Y0_15405 [Streptomyces sp. NPDC020707]|jgi:hypothetical protein|uniref:hypothetical protein n=1 Tax=Streptomyces TaxID=1883 RepID=UPI0028D2C9C6|nr:hypothetical protein [Streptomyces sp. DSM 40484]